MSVVRSSSGSAGTPVSTVGLVPAVAQPESQLRGRAEVDADVDLTVALAQFVTCYAVAVQVDVFDLLLGGQIGCTKNLCRTSIGW